MQNKAPQGKQDPIPTPESELEQYGVWVKAEPQDVVEEPVSGKPTSMTKTDDSENPIPGLDEAELVDSFEFDETIVKGIEELETLSPVDDLEIIGELPEEMEAFDLEALENVDLEPLQVPQTDDGSEESALEISLDELDYEEPEDDFEPGSLEPEEKPRDSFETTDINIDDFGLSGENESAALPSLDDFSTIESSPNKTEADRSLENSISEDFESLDIDLQFDDTIPEVNSVEISEAFTSADDASIDVTSDFESVDIDSIGFEPAAIEATLTSPAPVTMETESGLAESSNISMDSFIDLDDSDASGIVPDMQLENVSLNDEPIGFDDVQAVSDDLSTKISEPSSDLLQKIVLELSSIKEELVSLRGQLSSLKSTNQVLPLKEEETETVEEGAPGGFFDEEDDDTIALTGDELDNILNTADFTEEVADNESFDDHANISLEIPDDIELLPEDGVYETQESGIETIELPTIQPTEDEFLSISAQDGVTPLTNLPEDTSFLDSTEDGISLELEMPLEDVPLVEPNSSDLDSIIDSAFDTGDTEFADLEIPVEENDSEIVLDFNSDDEPVISTVDSFPEPLDEIEDALELEEFVEAEDLGGLELLAEESELEELEELEELSLDEEDPSTLMVEEAELEGNSPDDLEDLSAPSIFDSNQLISSQASDLYVETPSQDELEEIETNLEPEATLQETDTIKNEKLDTTVGDAVELDAVSGTEVEPANSDSLVPDKLKHDIKSVLLYLDQLLASLPEEKIEEFASSEYYDTYKRLFDDLGLL